LIEKGIFLLNYAEEKVVKTEYFNYTRRKIGGLCKISHDTVAVGSGDSIELINLNTKKKKKIIETEKFAFNGMIEISGLLFVSYNDAGVLVFKDASLIHSFSQLGDPTSGGLLANPYCFDAKKEGNHICVLVSVATYSSEEIHSDIWEIKAFLD